MNSLHKSNIITKLLSILMICITGYLFIVSLFSTVYVAETEYIFYVKDYALKNIGIIVLVMSVCIALKGRVTKLLNKSEGAKLASASSGASAASKMVLINTVVLGLILIIFVSTTQLYPLYDQAKVLTAVKHLFVYDYSDFLPGGYMDRCDVQWGIMLYFYAISKICGRVSILVFQLLNVLYILIANFAVYKISSRLFSRNTAAIIHLALCLFIPQWFYSSFVYGTVPSYMLCTLAVWIFTELVYRGKKWLSILVMALLMSIAIVLKTNSVIVMIALIILSLYIAISEKKPEFIIYSALFILCWMEMTKTVNGYVNYMTQIQCQGMPRMSHIAMAQQDNSDKGPGWYNGYVDELYEASGFDKETATSEAKNNLNESMARFKSNPASLISFISRKVVTQWNEPTFESLYILYGRDSIPGMNSLTLNIVNPTTSLNAALREIMNLIHVMVMFGALMYFILGWKKISISQLSLAIIVIGGFLFHILWEAKSQYILNYFLLLIPYSVAGVKMFAECILGIIASMSNTGRIANAGELEIVGCSDKSGEIASTNKSEITTKSAKSDTIKNSDKSAINILKRDNKEYVIAAILIAVICLVVAIVPDGSEIAKLSKPSWKTDEYRSAINHESNPYEPAGKLDEEYAQSLKMPKYKKYGRHIIETEDGKDCYINVDGSQININGQMVLIFGDDNCSYIRFQGNQKVADVNLGEVVEGALIQEWEYNGDAGQQFVINELEEGLNTIQCGEFVLGRDADGNAIIVNQGVSEEIRFVLEKVK